MSCVASRGSSRPRTAGNLDLDSVVQADALDLAYGAQEPSCAAAGVPRVVRTASGGSGIGRWVIDMRVSFSVTAAREMGSSQRVHTRR
jgi:hypothetical protein